jgi:beta propeller repeat protein
VVYQKEGTYKIYGYDLYWQSEFEVPDSMAHNGAKVDGNLIVFDFLSVAVDLFDTIQWQKFRIIYEYANSFDISGNFVVWSNGYDINCIDISDHNNPIELMICSNACNPAISGNIVVWQDVRNGNWDIYGYDISTHTEFQITDNTADQEYPDISGHTVVWVDKRNGHKDIYATILYGAQVPKCLSPLQGDLNKDCKVDFTDFALLAANWLQCELDPPEVCWH